MGPGRKTKLGDHMSGSENQSDVEIVAIAVKGLDPQPRQARWGHLSLCILDATFSINAKYNSTAAPLVHRYAKWSGLSSVLFRGEELAKQISPRHDEQTLSAFLESIGQRNDEDFAVEVLHNRSRTSTRGGVLKSEASRRIAQVLVDAQIETLSDASALLADVGHLGKVESALAGIRGSGTRGIRTGYLWMNAGDDQHVKPDRHVLRWLSQLLERQVGVAEARLLLAESAQHLDLTPWAVDHAIWKHMANPNR